MDGMIDHVPYFLGLPKVRKRQDKELLLSASANRDTGAVGTQ